MVDVSSQFEPYCALCWDAVPLTLKVVYIDKGFFGLKILIALKLPFNHVLGSVGGNVFKDPSLIGYHAL
jgi:hypothetical protein